MFSILHISDLHRSPDDSIGNDTLIASLLNDRDQYIINSSVPSPNAIIVSGDIIWGIGLGASDWEQKIKQQYDVAYDFLSRLTEQFIGGDKSRLIIVPGNHDCCWNTARNSMEAIDQKKEPKNIQHHFYDAQSKYRWSWAERKSYQIIDEDLYNRRFHLYWDFIQHFYEGVDLIRPLDCEKGFNLFEIDGGNIIVAAFESTHGNDCFSYAGVIPNEVISKCNLELRESKKGIFFKYWCLAPWYLGRSK